MTRIRPPSLFLIAALALGISACDDGTSPLDFHGLDPAAVTAAVNALSVPMQGSSEAITNYGGAREDLVAEGVDLGSPTVQFPDEVTGSTFVFDAEAQGWVIDETRAGGPAEGVRVLWYPLDSTGRVIDATESGYIDIQPADVPGTNPIAIQVVESDGDAAPLLNFTRDYSWTANGDDIEAFEAEGSYAHAGRTVNFSFESMETTTAATGDVDYFYTSLMQDADTRYELTAESAVDGATDSYENAITATIERGGATTVVEVRFQGVGETQQEVDGFVRHDGATVALVELRGEGYAFTTPDGDNVSATQSNELNALFGTVMLSGLLLYEFELRMFFPAD